MMEEVTVYTDGSYFNNCAGYGAVIIKDEAVIHTLSGPVTDLSLLKHRQVAGEVIAVQKALAWCNENSIKSVTLHYDYMGVRCWADGSWKAKTKLTREYAAYIQSLQLKVHWIKVKAHSGDKYNEEADRLAKRECSAASATDSTSPSAPQKPKAALQQEAEHAATDIMTALFADDIICSYAGFFNNMYARVEIMEEGKRVGILDIYNTQKKRLSIDARGFKSNQTQSIVTHIALHVLNLYK